MSKRNDIIMISPPLFLDRFQKETIVSIGHKCTHCQGNGWHWTNNEFGESVKKPCIACKGTKKVRAKITIEWLPDK